MYYVLIFNLFLSQVVILLKPPVPNLEVLNDWLIILTTTTTTILNIHSTLKIALEVHPFLCPSGTIIQWLYDTIKVGDVEHDLYAGSDEDVQEQDQDPDLDMDDQDHDQDQDQDLDVLEDTCDVDVDSVVSHPVWEASF
jgi:hypothetical protein